MNQEQPHTTNEVTSKLSVFIKYSVFILVILSIFVIIYFVGASDDRKCLDHYAEKYCTSINMSLSPNIPLTSDFTCFERTSRAFTDKSFKYLDEERQICRVKDPYTFKYKGSSWEIDNDK